MNTIFKYVKDHDLDGVKKQIAKGDSLDEINPENSYTVFMTAAKYGFVDIMKWLVEEDAEYLYENILGETALYVAVISTQVDSVLYLMSLDGVNPRSVINQGDINKTYLSVAEDKYEELRAVNIEVNSQVSLMTPARVIIALLTAHDAE